MMAVALGAGISAHAADTLTLANPLCVGSTFVRRTIVPSEADLRAAIQPEGWAQVAVRRLSPATVEVAITVAKGSQGQATLTLTGSDGHTVASTPVQLVTLTSTAVSGINSEVKLADGADVFLGELVLSPHVPGLDLRFVSLGKGNTVQDGRPEWWVASETFTPIPLTGASWTPFRIVRAPKAKWVPYTAALYQNGEQVGTF